MRINFKLQFSLLVLAVCVLFTPILVAEHLPPHQKVRQGDIKVKGGKLFYQSFGVGAPVVVLHGGPGLDQTYLLPQMQELARHNTVTFYDQRGSGQSLGFNLTPESINMDRFVTDLEAVRNQLHYHKMILVGHSWGGLLAMNYAIKYPHRVEKLVLLDSAAASSAGFDVFLNEYKVRTASIMQKLLKLQETDGFKKFEPLAIAEYFRTLFSVYFYNPQQVSQLSLKFTATSAKDGFKVGEIFSQTYLQKYDIKQKIAKLKMPVLIVHGEQDIVPVWTAYELHGLIPKSKLVVIKECDHFPYIEQPAEFFTVMKDFINSATTISKR